MLGLALLVLLLFADFVFGRGVFFQRDIHSMWYPRTESMVRAVAEGAWPLWDPYSAFGAPALADPSYQLAYPPTWLNLVLFPGQYYKLYVLGHCFGAGLGLYFLCLRLGMPPLASFVAGAVFMTSGPFLSFPCVLHHFAGLAVMPWVLLALERALADGRLRTALLLGAAAAWQILAGSGDMCLLTGLIAVVRAGVLVLSTRGAFASRLGAVGRTGLAALGFALLLSGAQWLPTVAILGSGSRLRLEPAVNMYWSLHPLSLVDLVAPRLTSGIPLGTEARAALFESREPFLASLYLGAAAFALVALGALGRSGTPRAFALSGFFFFAVAALGRHTPLYPLLLHVPGFSVLRYPVKCMGTAGLFWAVLAGRGVEVWRRAWSEDDRQRGLWASGLAVLLSACAFGLGASMRWLPDFYRPVLAAEVDVTSVLAKASLKLFVSGGVALLAGLLVSVRSRGAAASGAATAALVFLTLADLVGAGRQVNPAAPPELLAHRPPLVEEVRKGPAGHRLYVVPHGLSWLNRQVVRGPARWDPEWVWTLGLQDLMYPPIGGRFGVEGSYDGDFTGLAPPALSFLGQVIYANWRSPLATKLLQMGNVAYVSSLQDGAPPGLTDAAQLPSVFAAPIRLMRVPDPLPRAYAVDGVRVSEGPQSSVIFWDPAFDPHREIILEEGSRRPPGKDFASWARVRRRRADAVTLEAELNAPGWVVLVETHHPGWTATLDGAPVRILRANGLFRAVPAPPGRHRIEFRYRPAAVTIGSCLSVCGVAAGLGFAFFLRRRSAAPPLVARAEITL